MQTGTLTIESSFAEQAFPFRFATEEGTLELFPPLVAFQPSFPGIVRSASVFGLSTYGQPLTILRWVQRLRVNGWG